MNNMHIHIPEVEEDDGDDEWQQQQQQQQIDVAALTGTTLPPLLHKFCGRWKRVGARGLNGLQNCDAPWLSEFLNISILPSTDDSNPFSHPCLAVERYAALEAEQGGAEVNYFPLITNTCLLYTSPSPRDRG